MGVAPDQARRSIRYAKRRPDWQRDNDRCVRHATNASRSLRHAAGGLPTSRLKARANAASES